MEVVLRDSTGFKTKFEIFLFLFKSIVVLAAGETFEEL